MPAHIKAMLTSVSLSMSGGGAEGRLWARGRAFYLIEHRARQQ